MISPIRLKALLVKEQKQLFRDPMNLMVGIFLPLMLLILMGYGMSFDIKNVRVAVAELDRSALSREIVAQINGSEYLDALVFASTAEAVQSIQRNQADAGIFFPAHFERSLLQGTPAEVLIVVNASNPSQAILKENYLQAIVSEVLCQYGKAEPRVQVFSKMRYNESAESLYFMIPGLLVIIITMIGSLLTCMLLAREYEQGNMESMFVTPMRSLELLIAKALNNFIIGMIGVCMTLLAVRFVFEMPIRGSVAVILLGCAMYLLLALTIGLLISSITKSQFLASEVTMVVTFLPAIMLSGFIYEINNLPLPVQYLTRIVPARYFIDFLQTAFLVGNQWSILLYDLTMIGLFTMLMLFLAIRKSPKSLEA